LSRIPEVLIAQGFVEFESLSVGRITRGTVYELRVAQLTVVKPALLTGRSFFPTQSNCTKLINSGARMRDVLAGSLEKVRRMRPNERFIQSLKVECHDKFVIIAERHLDHVCREWRHEERGHLPPGCAKAPETVATVWPSDIVCSSRLGGLLNSYRRRAA
jgi:hypothetical protein